MSSTRVRPQHAASRPRYLVLQVFAWIIAGATGFGLVFVEAYATQIEAQITTEDITPLLGDNRPAAPVPPQDGAAGTPVNIVLMGSDARDGSNESYGGGADGQRNDTTLIMHISADRSRIEVVSIPRDTIVRIPDCTLSDGTNVRGWTGQFNIAFANGGREGSQTDAAACTVRAIESITGIFIHHYVVADFAGFAGMVDAVGGVPICIEDDIYSPKAGQLRLDAGPHVLDGRIALQYARARTGTGLGDGSDLSRIDRQQQLLKNLAAKVLSTDMLLRPDAITNFMAAVADSLTMDPDLGNLDRTVGLAFSLRNIDPNADLTFATAPVRGHPEQPGRLQLTSAADDVWAAIIADQPIAPYLDAGSDSPANEPLALAGGDDGEATEAPAEDDGDGAPAASGDDALADFSGVDQSILAACQP